MTKFWKTQGTIINGLTNMSAGRLRILQLTLIVFAGITAYSNTLLVPFVLDDFTAIDYLGQQNFVDILIHGSVRRVVDLTFVLNYKIHGLGLPGYHLVNLAIHLSVAIVLYCIVCSMLSALQETFPRQQNCLKCSGFTDKFLPFAVAMLFVCHPLQTQAVTYIIQRYTSMATFFYLLSVLFFLRARISYEKNGQYAYPWILGSFSLVAAILAIGSKQISVTLPAMLLLIEILIFNGRLINRRLLVGSAVLCTFVVMMLMVLWRVSTLQDFLNAVSAATSEDTRISRVAYFFTQTRIVVGYLRLLLLPVGQSVVHDSPIYTSLFSLPVIASLILHISLLVAAFALFRQSRQNFLSKNWEWGAPQRLACLGIVWFYCAMAVESSIFPIRDVMFEHRVYLPSVGFCMTVISFIVMAVCTFRAGNKVLWAILIVGCIVLGAMTVARNQLWNNKLLLWQDTVRKYPVNTLALANLGAEYLLLDMPEKAVPIYVHIMELGGDIPAFYLGNALKALNKYELRFTTGVEFMRPGGPMGSIVLAPEFAGKYRSVVFNTLALSYEYLGETDKALRSYRRSLKADPSYDLAWYNLGLFLNQLGERGEATIALTELRKYNPELARSLATNMAR